MEKKKSHAFGKDIYLLGRDVHGTNYWLEKASWDCGWYWGFGYVETYTNNRIPGKSKDISSHQHFNGLFFNLNKLSYDVFKEFFVETPLSNDEIWELLELMRSFYTAREYADMLHVGGSHFTTNPCKEIIQDLGEYDRINKVVIPAICEAVYDLLGGVE